MTDEEKDDRAFRVYKWYMICGGVIMFITAAFSYTLRHELSVAHRTIPIVVKGLSEIQREAESMNNIGHAGLSELERFRKELWVRFDILHSDLHGTFCSPATDEYLDKYRNLNP